ncbi:hypothetical protein Dimus_017449 [Dionaea muscipula]
MPRGPSVTFFVHSCSDRVGSCSVGSDYYDAEVMMGFNSSGVLVSDWVSILADLVLRFSRVSSVIVAQAVHGGWSIPLTLFSWSAFSSVPLAPVYPWEVSGMPSGVVTEVLIRGLRPLPLSMLAHLVFQNFAVAV